MLVWNLLVIGVMTASRRARVYGYASGLAGRTNLMSASLSTFPIWLYSSSAFSFVIVLWRYVG